MPLYATGLFVGIFIVWFPTVLYLQRFNKEMRGGFGLGGWKYVVAGAPAWLIAVAVLAFAYAIVNFMLLIPTQGDSADTFGIGASGHAMAFYSIAALVNWAAVQREIRGLEWKCERGHRMAPSEKFCSECGAPSKARRGPGFRQGTA
jgi:hypothetical protein